MGNSSPKYRGPATHCGICGAEFPPGYRWHTDHIVPRSEGGSNQQDNLQPVHRICNSAKGTKTGWKSLRPAVVTRNQNPKGEQDEWIESWGQFPARPAAGSLDAITGILHAPEGVYRSPLQKLVAVAIADHVDHDGQCWPSVSTIAALAGASYRQTQRELSDLKDRGLLQYVDRRRHADGSLGVRVYRLWIIPESHRTPRSGRGAPTGHSAPSLPDTHVRAEPPKEPVTRSSTGSPARVRHLPGSGVIGGSAVRGLSDEARAALADLDAQERAS